ncbi:MAG: GGDEF domain-containing protein [Lachnospiraceae bacterium]|nr:GGDEF domain-containing protein [Lachnospiraceae bacterium]
MDQHTEPVKHSVIGIIATSFHSDFSRMIVTQICDRFKDENVEVHMYLGMDSSRYLYDYDEDTGMEAQYFSHFTYTNFDDLDLLIISGEAIYTEMKGKIPCMEEVLEKLPDVPKIIISSSEGRDAIHIRIDNYGAEKKLIEFLAKERGCKRIAFLSGNPEIPDAKERLKAYRDAVSELGLDDDKDLIAIGNFTSNCDHLVERFFAEGKRPDAIVCANDEMAVSAYRVAKKHGLTIGKDIFVTGFDDINIAAAMEPPLTTVGQDFGKMADAVTEAAYDYLISKTMEDRILGAKCIFRASCGCGNYDFEDEGTDDRGKDYVIGEYSDLKSGHINQVKGALLLRSLLMQPITVKSFFQKLGERLMSMGVTNALISIHEKPYVIKNTDKIYKPSQQKLVLVINNDRVYSYDTDDAPDLYSDRHSERSDARNNVMHTDDGNWCTYLLFYGDIQYGCLVVKLELGDVMFYYALSLEIGSAMRYLYLALEQQGMQAKLEIQNEILDYSASHDALTGLFNRAGVFKYIYESYSGHNDETFIAVMADLDHLKQINDNFGHEAGDYAITAAAGILTKALGDRSKFGRTGGDEFVCVFEKTDDLTADIFKNRIKELCKTENETNNKPFYVEISIGCFEVKLSDLRDLSKIFKIADDNLYEAKKHRRESVIR